MNPENGEKNDVENSWCISELKTCPNLRINLLTPTNIVLDYVKAHNVELCVRLGKKNAKISLNGVPKFLVDAFGWLESNNAYCIDGIFRKEGNATRIKNAWNIYCGFSPIHDDYNAHDVCSLIKRFFREIKTPIFTENQMIILRFAESLRDTILIDAILSVIERLPSSHISTITFLMKHLKKVSEYSGENHMNIENLATVFAPSLFRDETVFNQSVKKKRDMQYRLMNFVRSRNGLRILVVKSLIENAHLLGFVHKHDHYSFDEKKVMNEVITKKHVESLTNDNEKIESELQKQILSEKQTAELMNQLESDKCFDIDERLIETEELHLLEFENSEVNEEEKANNSEEIKFDIKEKLLNNKEEYLNEEDFGKENLNLNSLSFLNNSNVATTFIKPVCLKNKGNSPRRKNEVILRRNQPHSMMFPRRTREYKSEKEMICTYCDSRGHLCQACPNN